MLAHPPAALDLLTVELARPLGEIPVRPPELVDRAREVDGSGASALESPSGFVQILPARSGERIAVRGGDPNRWSAADGEGADRFRDLGSRAALELYLLAREPALVEEDDPVVLEAHDLLGREIASCSRLARRRRPKCGAGASQATAQ